MNNLPVYKRLQGNFHSRADDEMDAQNSQHELYSEAGIVNGNIGSLSADEIRADIDRIVALDCERDMKLELFDALYFKGLNNMEYFRIDPVEEDVRDAYRNALYGGE